jgi:hypothetical protein
MTKDGRNVNTTASIRPVFHSQPGVCRRRGVQNRIHLLRGARENLRRPSRVSGRSELDRAIADYTSSIWAKWSGTRPTTLAEELRMDSHRCQRDQRQGANHRRGLPCSAQRAESSPHSPSWELERSSWPVGPNVRRSPGETYVSTIEGAKRRAWFTGPRSSGRATQFVQVIVTRALSDHPSFVMPGRIAG